MTEENKDLAPGQTDVSEDQQATDETQSETGQPGEDFSLFTDLPDEAVGEKDGSDAVEELPLESEIGLAPEELNEIDLLAGVIDDVQLDDSDLHEIERRSKMRWYVIHANTGHENKVQRNIEMAIRTNHMEDLFGEVLVATQEVTEMKNGKRSTTKRKFFPSYILVEMQMTKETQHFINTIPGVTRFIGGTALAPQPITKEEVDRIMGRMAAPTEAKSIMEIPYNVGDRVQVIDGPFSEWEGVINEINRDKGKLKVMIAIFGKETPTELDFLQVKLV